MGNRQLGPLLEVPSGQVLGVLFLLLGLLLEGLLEEFWGGFLVVGFDQIQYEIVILIYEVLNFKGLIINYFQCSRGREN